MHTHWWFSKNLDTLGVHIIYRCLLYTSLHWNRYWYFLHRICTIWFCCGFFWIGTPPKDKTDKKSRKLANQPSITAMFTRTWDVYLQTACFFNSLNYVVINYYYQVVARSFVLVQGKGSLWLMMTRASLTQIKKRKWRKWN